MERFRGYITLTLVYLVIWWGTVYYLRRPPGEPITIIYPTPSPVSETVVVYVSGVVARPGVYELGAGARVSDALELAGGALEGAELAQVNLARRVRDEDQIYIPRVGEEVRFSPSAGSSGEREGPININTDTAAELESLLGIGEVIAQRIVEYREKNGPFETIEDIKKVSGIGEKTFEQLKDRIVVR